MSEKALFDMPVAERPLDATLSVDRRRTLRYRAMLERGFHPVSHRALRGEGTCGECEHCHVKGMSRRYYKCDLNSTGSPSTDIRLKWPACVSFVARLEAAGQ